MGRPRKTEEHIKKTRTKKVEEPKVKTEQFEVQERVKEEEPSAPSVVDYTVIAPHGLNIRENKPSNTDAPFHDNIPIITAMNYGDTFHCEKVEGLWNYGYYDCNGKTYYGWACGNNGIWLKKR